MSEYQLRLDEAHSVARKLEGHTYGMLLAGSVAYNPGAVTPSSDLDMVAVLDFATADWVDIFRQLGMDPKMNFIANARERRMNTASIVYNTDEFEVGLHCWDTTAWKNITGLEDATNIVYRPASLDNMRGTPEVEVLRNLRGEEMEIFKDVKDAQGGSVMQLYPFLDDGTEFYLGTQGTNMLLNPIVLVQRAGYITDGMRSFASMLQVVLHSIYTESSEESNLVRALPEKVQQKLPSELEEALMKFF